ncbi:glycosyltransferase family 2 protein [Mesorhizobium sp. SP-1A]|uniref:glycosyltransferase family 2 protein n=1 Tax=Mesorhizobium sp. SP-1A TaxID=3077840 RepID=UPI0028F6EB11|nr:glycosyltransferase family 2 protein [Mesorhizobium sp. SP-1A]
MSSEILERPEIEVRPANLGRCMVVIPCLNEVDHIGDLIDQLLEPAERLGMKIVVADGGSTDGTRSTVREITETEPRVVLLENPRRLQSAALNLAVAEFGHEADYLIRIDAHGGYPDDYCERLLEEALETGADSVVVSMATMGFGPFQKATAAAQNSKLGNGGSPHREGVPGHWTDHGHHALMRVEAFRAVGGYDESFSHNEDAELDHRLAAAGYRIWMTDKTFMTYYPRATAGALFRQYLGYGRGRARNIIKHGTQLKTRQAIPLLVLPAVAGTSLAVLSTTALIPAALWAAACLGYGTWMAVSQRNPYGPLAGVSAMVMHLAWSTGFWLEYLKAWRQQPWKKREAPAA